MKMINIAAGTFRMGEANPIGGHEPAMKHALRGKSFCRDTLTYPNGYVALDTMDKVWKDEFPAPGGCRVEGFFRAPTSKPITFTADAEAGFRLLLNGENVVDLWLPDAASKRLMHWNQEMRRGTITLEEGKLYPVVIELWYTAPGGRLRLLWEWEGRSKEIVPIETFQPYPWEAGQSIASNALGGSWVFPYGNADEKPLREVTISRGFKISETKVTAEQYREFDPSYTGEGFATGLNWHRAMAYCEWLSEKTGKPCRLPTEAEWECACRAGGAGWFGAGPGHCKPHADEANAWGIRGMNAGPEWTLDWYRPYPCEDETDPVGPAEGIAKVVRGGAIHDGAPAVAPVFDNSNSINLPEVNRHADVFHRSGNRSAVEPTFPPTPSGKPVQARVLAGKIFTDAGMQRGARNFVLESLDKDFGPVSDYYGGPGMLWSARVEGALNGPVDGEVTFVAEVHEGVRLYLDDALVLDGWGIDAARTGRVAMEAGRKYKCVIEIFETHGKGALRLLWSWKGQPQQVVPMSAFDERSVPAPEFVTPIGFRVVEGELPETAPRRVRPFGFSAVRQNTDLAREAGPDPEQPYYRRRNLLPVPPEDCPLEVIEAAGLNGFGSHNEAPAVTVCPNGDVLATFYSAPIRPGEFYSEVPNIVSRLRFGAEEWDMPEIIYNHADLVGSSCLLWTEGEKIWAFFGACGWHGIPFRFMTSEDSGRTWSPMQMPRLTGVVGTFSPQPINTMFRNPESGRLYMASDGHGLKLGYSSMLWASDDEGETWFDLGGRSYTRHTPFVMLEDGTIFGCGGKNRNYDGYQPNSLSDDGGKTYRIERSDFPYVWTKQRPSCIRLASGRLFYASDWQKTGDGWAPHGVDERGCFVALSEDEGRSWHFKTLEDAPPSEAIDARDVDEYGMEGWHAEGILGYSVAQQGPNGVIHLVSSFNHPAQHYEMNEAWILSGAQVLEIDNGASPEALETFEEQYEDGSPRCRWSGYRAPDGRFVAHGEEQHFLPDGGVEYRCSYDRGRRVGMEVFHDGDGRRRWEREHREDGTTVWTQWWENGTKRHESKWRGMWCHGHARCWSPEGRQVRDMEFEHGHPVRQWGAPWPRLVPHRIEGSRM